MNKSVVLVLLATAAIFQPPIVAQQTPPFARDPKIAIDADYTAKIKEYTTESFFTSPLVFVSALFRSPTCPCLSGR